MAASASVTHRIVALGRIAEIIDWAAIRCGTASGWRLHVVIDHLSRTTEVRAGRSRRSSSATTGANSSTPSTTERREPSSVSSPTRRASASPSSSPDVVRRSLSTSTFPTSDLPTEQRRRRTECRALPAALPRDMAAPACGPHRSPRRDDRRRGRRPATQTLRPARPRHRRRPCHWDPGQSDSSLSAPGHPGSCGGRRVMREQVTPAQSSTPVARSRR